ncbi:hypothetical protein GFS31_43680 (plasmid) [Leptolyngbya sp. BL0902]|nr:hypothetical protein GFS31_43680 [Leptolyngbya sp. BL0902]
MDWSGVTAPRAVDFASFQSLRGFGVDWSDPRLIQGSTLDRFNP